MTGPSCREIEDVLPDAVGGRLENDAAARVAAHLAACSACAATADVLRLLSRNPVAVPTGLAGRVASHVRETSPWPWWRRSPRAVALAASVAIALLGGSIWFGTGPRTSVSEADDAAAWSYAQGLLHPFPSWPGSDGYLAGAVVIESLTDTELETLLAELDW